jgi:hypothetical protein
LPRPIEPLAPHLRLEHVIVKRHRETAKQHVARRHFINQRIEPVGEKQLVVGCLATNLDDRVCSDLRGVGDHGRHRQRGLLERLAEPSADAAYADVGAMRKMFPDHRVATDRCRLKFDLHRKGSLGSPERGSSDTVCSGVPAGPLTRINNG